MRFKASARAALIAAAAMCIGFSAPSQAQQATGQTQTATQQQPVALGKPLKLNKYAKHRSRHSRRHATRHSRKHTRAAKRHEDRKVEEAAAKKHDATHDTKAEDAKINAADVAKTRDAANDASKTAEAANTSPALNASVANARAQLLSPTADGTPAPMLSTRDVPSPTIGLTTPSSEATSSETPAGSPPASHVVAADELNEIDRSAGDAKEQASPAKPAVANAAQAANPATASPTPANLTLAMASLNTPNAGDGSTSGSTWAQTSLIGKIFIAFGGLLTLASAARMFIA